MKEYRNFIRFLVILAFSGFFSSNICQANSVHIKEKISSGNTEWTSAFSAEFNSHEIVISINISLLVSEGVRSSKLEEKINSWKGAIDAIWNGRFYTSVNNVKIPMKFNIKFTHHQPHHRVVIHPGGWAPNQHNWYINTPPFVVAHEIGHMLGAYDEYRGGALSPEDPIVDTTSIMGSKPLKGVAYPRHLSLLDKTLTAHFKNNQIKIMVTANL